MISTLLGVLLRIISNSYINVFQKLLANFGNKPVVINFYTYFGLTVLSLFLLPFVNLSFSNELLINFLLMGILGALGNYFIIKALSLEDLSSLAPINSYKPIVAMVGAFLYLNEIPSFSAVLGILLIIAGTYILYKRGKVSNTAIAYRILALIFSGTEAVFIKKIILLTNIPTSFILWSVSGLVFAFVLSGASKNNLKLPNIKYLSLLILTVALMQYSTNFVFSKINVAYALALFQLSTLLSIFLGANIFHEKDMTRKIIASFIMIFGSVVIILS